MTKRSTEWQECACGCGRKFKPARAWQKYRTIACKNRAAQARLRERARGYDEMMAENQGVMGNG